MGDCTLRCVELEKENALLKDRNFMVENFFKVSKENEEMSLVLKRVVNLARDEGSVEFRTLKHIIKNVVSFDQGVIGL